MGRDKQVSAHENGSKKKRTALEVYLDKLPLGTYRSHKVAEMAPGLGNELMRKGKLRRKVAIRGDTKWPRLHMRVLVGQLAGWGRDGQGKSERRTCVQLVHMATQW